MDLSGIKFPTSNDSSRKAIPNWPKAMTELKEVDTNFTNKTDTNNESMPDEDLK
jgi:hypothetical protein